MRASVCAPNTPFATIHRGRSNVRLRSLCSNRLSDHMHAHAHAQRYDELFFKTRGLMKKATEYREKLEAMLKVRVCVWSAH